MSSDGSTIIIGTPKKVRTIPFNANLAATTNVCLVAGRISFKYRVIEAEIIFNDETQSQLLIYVFTSRNANAPNTNPPPDNNVFSEFSPTPYFIGESVVKRAACNYEAEDGEYYIKVYASNLNAFTQIVNVSVKIEEI